MRLPAGVINTQWNKTSHYHNNTDTIGRRDAETWVELGVGVPHTMKGDAQPLGAQQHKACGLGH